MTKRGTYLLIFAALFAGIVFNSCEKLSCIEGNGDLQGENREIQDFNGVVSEGFFDVTIIHDTISSLFIEGESNVLPYISSRTEDGILIIKLREQRCIKNTLPVSIEIHTPSLESIRLEGSGEIRADSVNTEDMDLSISGSGDIHCGLVASSYLDASITGSGNMYIWGKNTESDLRIAGTGNIKAADLEQETSFVNISGSGNMHLWVTDFLDVKISGSGNVYYKGNPTVNVTITGSGSLIHN